MGWLFSKGPKQESKTSQIQGNTVRGKLGNLLPRQSQSPPSETGEEVVAAPSSVGTSALKNFPAANPYRTNLTLDDEDEPAVATVPLPTSAPLPSTLGEEEDDYGLGELAAHESANLPTDCLNTLLEDNVLAFISTNKARPAPQFLVVSEQPAPMPTSTPIPTSSPPSVTPASKFSIEAEQIEGLAATRTTKQAAAMEPVAEEPVQEEILEALAPPMDAPAMDFPEVTLPDLDDMTVDLVLDDLEPPMVEDAQEVLEEIEEEVEEIVDPLLQTKSEEPSLAELFNDQEIAATEDGKLDFSSLEELDYCDIDPAAVEVEENDGDVYEDILPPVNATELVSEASEETIVIAYDDDDEDVESLLVAEPDEDLSDFEFDELMPAALDSAEIDDAIDVDDVEALFHTPTFEDELPEAMFAPGNSWLNTAKPETVPTQYGLGVVFEQGPIDEKPFAADTSSAFDLDLKPETLQESWLCEDVRRRGARLIRLGREMEMIESKKLEAKQ